MSLTIGQFNMKYDGYPANCKEIPNWKQRQVDVIREIESRDFDIFTMQECTKEIYDILKGKLSGYQGQGVSNAKKSDGISIYYKKDRFSRLENEAWVNPQYNTSDAKEQNCNGGLRMHLTDNQTGKVIKVVTLHLKGGPKRYLGMDQLREVEKWSQSYDRPVDLTIFSGDFNNNQSDPRLDYMRDQGFEDLSKGLYSTELSKDGTPMPNRVLDHILIKGPKEGFVHDDTKADFLQCTKDRRKYLSDHALVSAKITFNKKMEQRVYAGSQVKAAVEPIDKLLLALTIRNNDLMQRYGAVIRDYFVSCKSIDLNNMYEFREFLVLIEVPEKMIHEALLTICEIDNGGKLDQEMQDYFRKGSGAASCDASRSSSGMKVSKKVEFTKAEVFECLKGLNQSNRGFSFKARIFITLMIVKPELIKEHGKSIAGALNNAEGLSKQLQQRFVDTLAMCFENEHVKDAVLEAARNTKDEADLIQFCQRHGYVVDRTAFKPKGNSATSGTSAAKGKKQEGCSIQ